jgi:hypothetical protein
MSTDRIVNSLLTAYKNAHEGEGELELRFKAIKFDAFKDIYNALNKSTEFKYGGMEYSINTISQNVYERTTQSKVDSTQYIRRQVFDNKGKKIEDKLIQKKKLEKPLHINDYMSYNLVVSQETDSLPFNTSLDALVRFKIRNSFLYSKDKPEWRFDLTVIKSGVLKNLADQVINVRNAIFIPRTRENFIESIANQSTYFDSYEVEVEYVGDRNTITKDSLSITDKLFSMINSEYIIDTKYQDEIYTVATYVISNRSIHHLFKKDKSLKDLTNQAKSLTKNMYINELYPPIGYYITDKADGIRCIISINGHRCRILADELIEVINTGANPGITIMDAELIRKGDTYSLYVFDIMVYMNENISDRPFTYRVEKIKPGVDILNSYVEGKAHVKQYIRLENNIEMAVKKIYESDHRYDIDGIIFTSPDDSYEDTVNYKWKPYEHTTIDFLSMKAPKGVIGKYPYISREDYDIYLLFVSIRHNVQDSLGLDLLPFYRQIFTKDHGSIRYPIQFSPSINPHAYIYYHHVKGGDMDNKIIELRRRRNVSQDKSYIDNGWEFIRERTDRKVEKNFFGNSFRVAESTYMNYVDEFTIEDLWKPRLGYFTKTSTMNREGIYRAPNAFKRYVISDLFKNNLSNAELVIDLASGRGGDIRRYMEIGVKRAIFVDKDPTALTELINRKFDLSEKLKERRGMITYIVEQDLNAEYRSIEMKLSRFMMGEKADGIVCNFAIHYFCNLQKNIKNFIALVNSITKLNGVFIFTTMNGADIFKLLSDIKFNEQWISKENTIVKYAIKKLYSGTTLTSAGQKISVKLPLSDEMYEEPLANIDTIVNELKTLGWNIEIRESFLSYEDSFNKFVPKDIASNITDEDRHYIRMHHFVVARKIKDSTIKRKK